MGEADEAVRIIEIVLGLGIIIAFGLIVLVLGLGLLIAYPFLLLIVGILAISYILQKKEDSVKCVRCGHRLGDHKDRTEYCEKPLCPCLHFRDPNVWKPGINWDPKTNTPKR